MKILQLIAVVLLSEIVHGRISEVTNDNKIASFIRDVIKDSNSKTNNNGDVAVFKINDDQHQNKIDKIYDQICQQIPADNPVLKPNHLKVVKNQKIWAASFTIIVSNANHPVINCHIFLNVVEKDF